jgi:hypothetical protein
MTTQDQYWSLDECRWVRWAPPEPEAVQIPEQQVPATAAEGDALPA